jgi:hypothetical protein
MFKREIQVKMVKNAKKDDTVQTSQPEPTFERKIAIATPYFERMVGKISTAVVTYIVLDTLRQVMIERSKHCRC